MFMIFCENILLLDAGFLFCNFIRIPIVLSCNISSEHSTDFLFVHQVTIEMPSLRIIPCADSSHVSDQGKQICFQSFLSKEMRRKIWGFDFHRFFWNVGKRESKICRETLWQTCLVWENPTIFQFQIPEIHLKNTSETNYKSLCGCSKNQLSLSKT